MDYLVFSTQEHIADLNAKLLADLRAQLAAVTAERDEALSALRNHNLCADGCTLAAHIRCIYADLEEASKLMREYKADLERERAAGAATLERLRDLAGSFERDDGTLEHDFEIDNALERTRDYLTAYDTALAAKPEGK